ncbi:MAG: HAD hydrolase family protein [Planctomycetota bacterium]
MALQDIRILLMDVDGVLTDGRLIFDADGRELKAFSAYDGLGLALARKAGLLRGIITARESSVVAHRAAELKLEELHQGAHDKLAVFEEVCDRRGLGLHEAAFIGDDLTDLRTLKKAGYSACPANAVPEIKAVCDLVTERRGGEGAVRELIEVILKARGLWADLLPGDDS